MDLIAREKNRLRTPSRCGAATCCGPDELPYQTAPGSVLDSGRYADCLDEALRLGEYDHWRDTQARLRTAGRLVGVGTACFVEGTTSNIRRSAGRWGPYEAATAWSRTAGWRCSSGCRRTARAWRRRWPRSPPTIWASRRTRSRCSTATRQAALRPRHLGQP